MQQQKRRVIIFLHGDLSHAALLRKHIQKGDLLICADGGTEIAHDLALIPDVVVGDFDSLSPKLRTWLKESSVPLITHPSEVDQYETDSELAIRYAYEQGIRDILITGFLGRRIDHLIANFFLFAQYPHDLHIRIIEGNQTLFFIRRKTTVSGTTGDLISLIPLSPQVTGITTKGLRYPLTNATLQMGTTLGISNVMSTPTATVTIKTGLLLGVHTWLQDVLQ